MLGIMTVIPMLVLMHTQSIEITVPLVEDFETGMLLSMLCASELGFGVTHTVKSGLLMPQWHLPRGEPG